jgi:ribonuclease HepT-like protein
MDSPRLRQLVADLQADREDLDRILDEGVRCLEDLASRAPTYLEVRGAGDIVHDFYNVVEHFFERVAVELNGGQPAGQDSHAQLLRRMSRQVEGVRPAAIDEALRGRLQEYLRFRHLFRHGYVFALEWDRLVPLLHGMRELSAELRRQFDTFIATMEELAERIE